MKPTEVDKIRLFRDALMKTYVDIGNSGREKLWIGHEIIGGFKGLLEYYDSLFANDLLNKQGK
jgi:hypothetical protein